MAKQRNEQKLTFMEDLPHSRGFQLSRWLRGKKSFCQFRRHRFDPCQEYPLEKKSGNPLQYSCLENPMDRGAWWAIVHGVVKESNTT